MHLWQLIHFSGSVFIMTLFSKLLILQNSTAKDKQRALVQIEIIISLICRFVKNDENKNLNRKYGCMGQKPHRTFRGSGFRLHWGFAPTPEGAAPIPCTDLLWKNSLLFFEVGIKIFIVAVFGRRSIVVRTVIFICLLHVFKIINRF